MAEHHVLVEDHGAAGDLPSVDVQPSQQVATLAYPEVDLVLEGLRYTSKFDRTSYSLSTVLGSIGCWSLDDEPGSAEPRPSASGSGSA
ncbi:MAG: hypothetical protein M3N95_00070 [Actinomycetota bacterium]|nr:hypothetical protein [Actinomycetota bacterium]